MVEWFRCRPWLVGAIALAIGLPVIIVAGIVATIFSEWASEGLFLAPGATLGPWTWAVTFVAISVAIWFLVRRCVCVGGWRTLGAGVGAVLVFAIGSAGMGEIEQRMQPNNGMAGVGGGIMAWFLAIFAVVVLVMGAIAIALDRAPRSGSSDSDEAGSSSRSSSVLCTPADARHDGPGPASDGRTRGRS